MATYNQYTAEQQAFLQANCKQMSRRELTDAFNARFGTSKSEYAIKAYCNNHGWNAGSDGRFHDGCVSWQKGLSGDDFKAHYSAESFERMTDKIKESNRKLKVGDEVIRHGIPMIVVSTDYSIKYEKRLVFKRRYVWEQAYGKIPDRHRIIHLDGNPMNCELDNLYCVPDSLIGALNKNHWLKGNRDITLTAIKLCELNKLLRSWSS